VDTPEGYEAVDNVDDVHVLFYGTTEHSIQGMGIYVNTDGKRFVNEGLGSSLVNQEVMQQHMARAYLILDEGIRDVIRKTPFCNAAVIGGDRIDHMIEMGMTVVQGETLEELAANIVATTADGVTFNPNNLLSTVSEYNEAATAGTADKLEVPHVGVTPAIPLATGPFYAIPVVGGIMATFGGLKINAQTQVIGTDARPIAGLYAVPGTAGGIMNGDYWCVMSGYSVLGRISGQASTEFAKSAGADA
jgi:succinate dehydrogenase/fumarate reductase flavoprotein subunit